VPVTRAAAVPAGPVLAAVGARGAGAVVAFAPGAWGARLVDDRL